jgi:hypothetical protein
VGRSEGKIDEKIMIYHLSLSPNAEADLLESALWYESRQIGLGEKFTQKVEAYFSRIQNNPLHFPFIIIYEIIENEIAVFSVFNTHQNPQRKP